MHLYGNQFTAYFCINNAFDPKVAVCLAIQKVFQSLQVDSIRHRHCAGRDTVRRWRADTVGMSPSLCRLAMARRMIVPQVLLRLR